MEKKGNNTFILGVVVAIISLLAIGCICYVFTMLMRENNKNIGNTTNTTNTSGENIINNTANNKENTISNTATSNEFKTVDFTISDIEKTANGYTISVHLLDNEIRKVSKAEYENVLNGGSIKFRGREWILSRKDQVWTLLKDKENGKEGIGIGLPNWGNDAEKESYYSFWNIAGSEQRLKDYKSDDIIKISVSSDIKCRDTFGSFEYDENTKTVKVKDFQDNYITGESMEDFIARFKELYNNPSRSGECTGYFIGEDMVALNSHVATGP